MVRLGKRSAVPRKWSPSGFQTGSASGAFQTSYTEFNSGATKTIAGLEGLSTFLKKAAEAFEKTDAELGKALKG